MLLVGLDIAEIEKTVDFITFHSLKNSDYLLEEQ
jgi:hypothetical protein